MSRPVLAHVRTVRTKLATENNVGRQDPIRVEIECRNRSRRSCSRDWMEPVAIELAASRPANLLGVILIASFAFPPRAGWLKGMPWQTLFRFTPPIGLVKRLLMASRSEASRLRAAIGRVDPDVLAKRVREALSIDVIDKLADIACPIVYLQATHDRVVPKSSLDRIAAIRTDTRRVIVDSLHLIAQDEPMAVVDTIRELGIRKPAGLTID